MSADGDGVNEDATNARVQTAMQAAMADAGLSYADLARRVSADRARGQVYGVIHGQRSRVPAGLVEVLDALGLELCVRAVDEAATGDAAVEDPAAADS